MYLRLKDFLFHFKEVGREDWELFKKIYQEAH